MRKRKTKVTRSRSTLAQERGQLRSVYEIEWQGRVSGPDDADQTLTQPALIKES